MSYQLRIKVPQKLEPIFSSQHRIIDLYGGRGSAKSWSVAELLVIRGYQGQKRALCTREYQNTIKESVHKLLADTIERLKLDSFYKVTDDSIRGRNGTEFIFKGLRKDPDGIKSMENLDYAWVEEAHTISRNSLKILVPTIRKENSQIIFTYNPTNEDDPVHVDYTLSNKPNVLRIECNWRDNPFFPKVLWDEMIYDYSNDPDGAEHVWGGQCIKHSQAQVFYKKWVVDDFEKYEIRDGKNELIFPDKNTFFYFGADWGFSSDPATLVRCFIFDYILYIDHEFYGIGVELDNLSVEFEKIPLSNKFPIIADSARPDTISHVRHRGFPLIKGADKGKGSVEDGIEFLKKFRKIVIHPRCKHTATEFRLYSYKVDERTGAISRKLEDKNNHIIDALRYALEDLMQIRQVQATRSLAR